MHEFALAQDIVDTIQAKVTPDLCKVVQINLALGSFSGVVADSLDFGLKLILGEKNNPQALINISHVPTVARCHCGHTYELEEIFTPCPLCQSLNRTVVSGMDVVIKSVEITED